MYDKKILEQHYVPRINSQDKGHIILDWESEAAHLGRFEVVLKRLDLAGKRILDVGCGIGDFYQYLEERVDTFSYTGVDILPEMIEEAKRRYPGGTFITGDLLGDAVFRPGEFDVVYSSGIFNLKVGDNHSLLRKTLPVFFELSSEWVIFNLLDPGHPVQREIYYYFSPAEVEQMVKQFTPHVEIEYDYVPKDYTIFARK